ncbi:MAG: YfiT family bacillithiol transferase [Terriglobales bacterium]
MSADAQYPVGRFEKPGAYTATERAERIAILAAMPAEVRALTGGLGDKDLERRYRPGGWNVREVVHHLGDSHLNAYLRTKFTLSEDTPRVMGYDQALWAQSADYAEPVEMSLRLLEGLHQRWTVLLRAQPAEAFQRAMQHSEYGLMTLDHALALYAWHARHHTAHLRLALSASGVAGDGA